MTGAAVPVRLGRKKRAQVGNVVALRPAPETTDDIVRDVQERSRRQEEDILHRLRSLTAELSQRHRERAQECVPIGVAMDRPTLDNWIEIGKRMLGKGRRT